MTFLQVDVDKGSDIAHQEGVRSMPTFKIYKDGENVETTVGANMYELENTIREFVGVDQSQERVLTDEDLLSTRVSIFKNPLFLFILIGIIMFVIRKILEVE